MASNMIAKMLTGAAKWREMTEGSMPTLTLDQINGDILEIIVKYFHFKWKYSVESDSEELPHFGHLHIPPEKVVNVLLAAHYLDC